MTSSCDSCFWPQRLRRSVMSMPSVQRVRSEGISLQAFAKAIKRGLVERNSVWRQEGLLAHTDVSCQQCCLLGLHLHHKGLVVYLRKDTPRVARGLQVTARALGMAALRCSTASRKGNCIRMDYICSATVAFVEHEACKEARQ